jgi:LemA protein
MAIASRTTRRIVGHEGDVPAPAAHPALRAGAEHDDRRRGRHDPRSPSPGRGRLPTVIAGIVIGVVAFLLVLVVVFLYNRLVVLRNRTQNAWSQVDVQLRRRYDLVPNLVETVKGYAAHERGTFEEVTKARAAAETAAGVEQQAQAENALTAALRQLFAVAEAYPELRASENFQALQAQLAEIEGDIAVARQVYNDSVLTYMNATQTVPTNVIAGLFNFGPRPYFEIEEAARQPVRVQF